jgi:hypothetical protein
MNNAFSKRSVLIKRTMPVIALLFVCSATTLRANPNLITDGDFSGGPSFPGWSVVGGFDSIVWSYNIETPPNTAAAVFNSGDTTPDGVLSQTFDTVSGDTYALQFDYGSFYGNWYTPPQSMGVTVTNSGLNLIVGSLPINFNNPIDPPMTTYTFDFTATSTSSTLIFTDQFFNNTYSEDGVIANVSVTPQSVPDRVSTLLLLGLGVAALAGASCTMRRSVRA